MKKLLKVSLMLVLETILAGIMFAKVYNITIPFIFDNVPQISSVAGICIIGLFNFITAHKQNYAFDKDTSYLTIFLTDIAIYAIYAVIILIIKYIYKI